MSKLDINVGDEFPLDEGAPQRGHHRGRPSHGHAHHHGHHHNHHRHRRFGLGRFALLLVVAGLAALIVNHQMTAAMAYGLIGAGAGRDGQRKRPRSAAERTEAKSSKAIHLQES